MPFREQLIVALSKQILGPRNGFRETIVPDPSDEYVVGVLEPKDFTRGALALFGRAAVAGNQDISRMEEDEKAPDDEEDSDTGAGPAEITPELDPRALPKSVGISFVVQARDRPEVSFCATWARYRRAGNSWQRVPHYFIQRGVNAATDTSWPSDQDPGVKFVMRAVPVENGIHVSIYLVNVSPVSGHARMETEMLVFQPQLRIVCEGDTTLRPIRREIGVGEDEEGLELLYRERYAMARGHLCGAVWQEIDPERATGGRNATGHPFVWVDAAVLPPAERDHFSHPHVRTEFLPLYAVEQATLTGPPGEGLGQIEAQTIAELWSDPDALDRMLRPVLDSYAKWIRKEKEAASGLQGSYRDVTNRHLAQCDRALKRMLEGLALIKQDSDVRLAFCFMNKAMHQQSIWRNPSRPLKWYIFQIAFILQSITGLVKEDHPDRTLCDLLWLPTGAGKTEAYLGLAVFAICHRRRRAIKAGQTAPLDGVGVISRYTLRLLTIQQFRRALSVITACEFLRAAGWRPKGVKGEDHPWGISRFSAGLWVGGNVTPNHLLDHPGYDPDREREVSYLGAIGLLYGRERLRAAGSSVRVESGESEPAQVLNCPACRSILAVSPTTLAPGKQEVHWIVSSQQKPRPVAPSKIQPYRGLSATGVRITPLPNGSSYVISVEMKIAERSEIGPDIVDEWWSTVVKAAIDPGCREEFARPSRPGYFFRLSGPARTPIDFEIHCPNPGCDLNRTAWQESVPGSRGTAAAPILPAFEIPGKAGQGHGVPIPAYTVDDQIYGRCPSIVIATVDKFARLAFEPRAAALFGFVTRYDPERGYYREGAPPDTGNRRLGTGYPVGGFDPPSLVIQDELHLIDGPLGTMVGLYETGIEALATVSRNGKTIGPKYIASTATIRQAASQIRAVFNREFSQFPPPGTIADDSFFAISREPNPLDDALPGRLYIGVCAPGRGAQTPIIRIWTTLLQEAYGIRGSSGAADRSADQFWTLVGYFNSKRELAGAVGLYRQDIPGRLRVIANIRGQPVRELRDPIELSGRIKSIGIPGELDRLSRFPDNDVDAVFATSMFGTGVDVDRLGLMVVHGQPKTTANYIQATGRVGRQAGALVVTFLRATRPRDLDHYEFFVGYHRSLYRHVEPITVYPFSPRARERALGPLGVLILRNARQILGVPVPQDWVPEARPRRGVAPASGSRLMAARRRSREVQSLIQLAAMRVKTQPAGRNPDPNVVSGEISADMDLWEAVARNLPSRLVYYESSMTRGPTLPVVLGDPAHEERRLPQVFKNAPQSLREVESTVTFDDEG